MILSKIQKPFLTPLIFVSDENFGWRSNVSQPNYIQPPEYDTPFFDFSNGLNQTALNITGVYVDNVQYLEVPTLALYRTTEKSFYFDISAQILYIHPDHTKRLDSSLFSATLIIGFTNGEAGGVFYDENNILYEPLIEGTLDLEREVDKFVNNKLSLISNTLTLNNLGSDLDFLIDNIVAGSDIQYFYISNEDIEAGKKGLTAIYTGFITASTITTEQASIKLEDKRGQLNQKISNTYFDIATYPDIHDDVLDDLIPEGYGDLFNIPAYCTNGTILSGDVTYKYLTDGTSLSAVYLEIDDAWQQVTTLSEDPTNGEFVLSDAVGRNSGGNPYKARVICRARNIQNPGSILIDMIQRYLGLPFTQEYYDAINWATESQLLKDQYLYINKRQEFFIYIEELQNTANLPFIFDITADGKYIIKVDDITRAVSQTFDNLDNINNIKPIETDFQEYATSVKINYKENYESGKQLSVTRNDFEKDTFDIYRFYKELEFTLNSDSSTIAEEKALSALKEYKIARPLVSLTLDCINCIDVLDVIEFDNSVYIDEDKVREYNGVNKIKVSRVFQELSGETTEIEGFIINDIVSKGTKIYNQGILYNQQLYGQSLYSSTLVYTPEVG